MKFSVVTISFNQARFLEQALLSVLNTSVNLDYIVVDPGSSDGSRDILQRYSSRISKLILSPDDGPADGLRKGFAAATGDIFGFINADDYLLPNAMERVEEFFHNHPEVEVALGNGFKVDENGKVIRHYRPTLFDAKRYVYRAITVFQPGTFFRRSAYERAGGINPENRIAWDGELFLDMALTRSRFGRLDEDIACFRYYGTSISGSKSYLQKLRTDEKRLFQKTMGRPPNFVDWLLRIVYRIEKNLRKPFTV